MPGQISSLVYLFFDFVQFNHNLAKTVFYLGQALIQQLVVRQHFIYLF